MPFVTHDASQLQAGQFQQSPRELQGRFAGGDAYPLQADIHFNQHPLAQPGGGHRRADRHGLINVVNANDRVRDAAQLHQSGALLRTDDEIGDEHVPHTGGGHHFRLAQLGAGDPQRAGLEFLVGDGRDLVSLGMRPPRHAVLAAVGHHLGDVGLHHVEVDAQGWRIKIVRRRAQCREFHPRSP